MPLEERSVEIAAMLNQAEQVILDITPVSGASHQLLRQNYRLPPIMRGERTLDVGAGTSDFTAWLLEVGADAHAVDPRYSDRRDLLERASAGIATYRKKGLHELARETQEATDRFRTSSKRNSERYKAGSALHLPYGDNEFDFCFSSNAVLGYLDVFALALIHATLEAKRVTKSGGFIKFLPLDDSGRNDEEVMLRRQAHREWREWLAEQTDINPRFVNLSLRPRVQMTVIEVK